MVDQNEWCCLCDAPTVAVVTPRIGHDNFGEADEVARFPLCGECLAFEVLHLAGGVHRTQLEWARYTARRVAERCVPPRWAWMRHWHEVAELTERRWQQWLGWQEREARGLEGHLRYNPELRSLAS